MREVAAGLFQLRGATGPMVNFYLAGDVLIDCGWPWDWPLVLRQLRGRTVRAHAVTHAHPDHAGSSWRVCRALGIPFWCGARDVPAAETGNMGFGARRRYEAWVLLQKVFARMRGIPVDRALHEGDTVGGFTVVDSPGHTPGHVAFFREKDRVLLVGDVMIGRSFFTLERGIFQPLPMFNWNHQINRLSGRKLAALRPNVVCFGHGPVLKDPAKLERLAELVDHAHASIEG